MPDAPLIAEGLAGSLLERALRNGGDFAELYVERRSTFSLALDDRRVERAQSGLETGASVRVVAGESTYFAHVDGLAESDLERLADEVSAAVRLETTAVRPLRALVVGAPQAIEHASAVGSRRPQGRSCCASATSAPAPRATR